MFDEKKIIQAIITAKAPLSLVELTRLFRVKGDSRRAFRVLLTDLETRGKIMKVSGKNWTAPSGKSFHFVGRLEVTSRGFGFVRPDWSNIQGKPPFEGDVFISPRDMAAALDGDLVRAELTRHEKEGAAGRVLQVLEHSHKMIVGFYQQKNKREGEVIPRNRRIDRRITVPIPEPSLEVKDQDWVEVEVTEFPPGPAPLYGHVKSRLGTEGDRGIDVLLLLRDRGIVEEFPKSVELEVEAMDFDWKNDLKDREDYRKLPTITIDPETAKDFDDAISVEPRQGGGWRLYVHIADVAHFLKAGTALDREAIERSTSVYPVDRVVPMLPEKISNNLCSLVPNQDRLVLTAVIDLSPEGHMDHTEFHSSVIHSDYRFHYRQIQDLFDHWDGGTPEPAGAEKYSHLYEAIKNIRKLARILRTKRFKRGALDLDIPQLQVLFDDAGKVSALQFYPRFEAHTVIEECMLIANEAVAEYLTKKKAPLLYRIHESADEQRLEQLDPILRGFGIRLGGQKGNITPKDLQKALEQAQEHPAGHILRRLVLRALKRAQYDPENVGHFGLASENYCHFTSPIRRYPDVVVHRQVKALERHETLPYAREENDLDWLGEHTSHRERRAQEAEWEAVAIKSLEYMKRFVGEERDGYIASVQSFGIFIELVDQPVEGFIKKMNLPGDTYDTDENNMMLKGRRTGRVFKLADKVRVRIDKVDPLLREMDLSIVDTELEENPLQGRYAKKKVHSFKPPVKSAKKRGNPAPKKGKKKR